MFLLCQCLYGYFESVLLSLDYFHVFYTKLHFKIPIWFIYFGECAIRKMYVLFVWWLPSIAHFGHFIVAFANFCLGIFWYLFEMTKLILLCNVWYFWVMFYFLLLLTFQTDFQLILYEWGISLNKTENNISLVNVLGRWDGGLGRSHDDMWSFYIMVYIFWPNSADGNNSSLFLRSTHTHTHTHTHMSHVLIYLILLSNINWSMAYYNLLWYVYNFWAITTQVKSQKYQ